jgi:hypothetical protein
MRKREAGLLVILLAVAMLLLLSNDDDDNNHRVRYDCRIAEISPDYPAAVKDKCRRLSRIQEKEQEGNAHE